MLFKLPGTAQEATELLGKGKHPGQRRARQGLTIILAQPLIVLEPLLAARADQGARIALSGILETQVAEVAAAYGAHFAARVAAREEGWALIEGLRQ